MELKKRFNVRKLLIFVYFAAFGVYLAVGFMPAEASKSSSGMLSIPKIDLVSEITDVELINNKLETPDTIVGRYSTSDSNDFLFGHSTTVFADLNKMSLNDLINYNGREYRVVRIDMMPKSMIHMSELLSDRKIDSVTIMTCAGELYENGGASHRLILTAILNK